VLTQPLSEYTCIHVHPSSIFDVTAVVGRNVGSGLGYGHFVSFDC
jgi:hypothetical protein